MKGYFTIGDMDITGSSKKSPFLNYFILKRTNFIYFRSHIILHALKIILILVHLSVIYLQCVIICKDGKRAPTRGFATRNTYTVFRICFAGIFLSNHLCFIYLRNILSWMISDFIKVFI